MISGESIPVEKKDIIIGIIRFMEEKNILLNQKIKNDIINLEQMGKTVIVLAIGKNVQGLLAVADTIKDDSKLAINELKKMGIEIYMLTGDNKRAAMAVGKEAGIENILAEVLPENKAAKIEKLKSKNNLVAMVGDGINDAPALSRCWYCN